MSAGYEQVGDINFPPTERVLTGARWSTVAKTACPRSGAYGAYNTSEDVLPPEEEERRQRFFQRGHDICSAHRERDKALLEAEGYACEAEAEVHWGAGTGHIDLRAVGEKGRLVVEHTTTKGGDLSEHKVTQAVGYAIADGADAACVVSIDPHTYERHDYPIRIDTHRDRVLDLMGSVVEAVSAGTLPERCCATPFEGRYRQCPFVGTCFDGWVGDPPDRLIGLDAEILRLAAIEDEIRALPRSEPTDELEGERDALREKLAFFCEPGVEYVTAGISIRRTVSKPTTRFSLSKARKAGFDVGASAQDLAAFVSESTSERWTIRRVPGGAS